MEKYKIAGWWGSGKKWGKRGSAAHVAQLRGRGYKGVKVVQKAKKGYTVVYEKKGRGKPYFKW